MKPCKIHLISCGEKFRIAQDLVIGDYVVPEGFRTDFASIPVWAVPFIGLPTRKQFRRASILHDYLLVSKITTGKEADKIFYDLLKEDGTNKLKAYLMYLAVRYIRPWL